MIRTGISSLLILLIATSSLAQHYIGLSANFGNSVTYDPMNVGFERPISVSGSMNYLKRENIKNDWNINTRLSLGIIGYNQYVNGLDTLSTGTGIGSNVYFYETFYGQASLSLGKGFTIGRSPMNIEVGAGVSYNIHSNAPSQFSKLINNEVVFSSTTSSDSGSFTGIIVAEYNLNLGLRWIFAASYIRSLAPSISGTYEFYYSSIDYAGEFYIYQSELRIGFLYRLGPQ